MQTCKAEAVLHHFREIWQATADDSNGDDLTLTPDEDGEAMLAQSIEELEEEQFFDGGIVKMHSTI